MSIASFGVNKPVPVNLLMIGILLAGVILGLSLRREFFPEMDPDHAMVRIPYPGASPEEIEETLAIKVEDKLAELDEIDEMRTTLSEGGGGILIKFREGVGDVDKAVDDVEQALDSLTDLPDESETIQVSLFENKLPVIRTVVFGELDEEVLKSTIRTVRDDLRSLPGMGEAMVEGVRDYEIRVDVQSHALLQHGISLPQVADTIRSWMTDVPGGTVRTATGDVKVRTMGVAGRAEAIRQIVLSADAQGPSVCVGDIAAVTESFVDQQIINRYNGLPAAALIVFKVGDQDIVTMAEMVRAYVDGRNGEPFAPSGIRERLAVASWMSEDSAKEMKTDRLRAWELGASSTQPLPSGAQLDVNTDLARFVESRLELLTRNACYGATLVFLTLLFFLNWRVALWVGMGLLTAMMGTLVLMSVSGITLNLLTMFGLIVVLGLLVDDAIVVSENIQTRNDRGEPALTAAIKGTHQVHWPVIATVLTSIVAFLPLTFIRGQIGDMLGALPYVVACALAMSLVESLLILPSHIGHTLAKRAQKRPGLLTTHIRRAEKWRDHVLLDRLVPLYARLLTAALKRRYLSVAIAVAALIMSFGLVAGGRVTYIFLPRSDAESFVINVKMPVGTAVARTTEAADKIERAVRSQPETLNISTAVGITANYETGVVDAVSPHVAQIYVELKAVEARDRESAQIIGSIRDRLKGKLDEVDRMTYAPLSGGPGGRDISIQVSGDNPGKVDAAVAKLKRVLSGFEGIYDLADDSDRGQLEMRVNLKPGASAMGFTTGDVARQVRGFLYGIDAHVFAERREDIDVRVRIDEKSRRSLVAIQNCWLISPTGQSVPLGEIADVTESTSYASIKRVDRKRAVTVSADTAPGISPETIVAQLVSPAKSQSGDIGLSPLDQLKAEFPDLKIEYAGRQEQQADAFASLPYGFLAAVVMNYVILAWLFSSYTQPLVVMLVIPFAFIGSVLGHMFLGYDMTFLSLIGFVALSGIVVNDSLILVQFYNVERGHGSSVFDSLVAAGRARMRAILLTTITTVLGLTPLILERSFQAKFLIPMAISLAAGLIAATMVVLIVVPCFLLILDDLKATAHFLWHGIPRPAPPVAEDSESAPAPV